MLLNAEKKDICSNFVLYLDKFKISHEIRTEGKLK